MCISVDLNFRNSVAPGFTPNIGSLGAAVYVGTFVTNHGASPQAGFHLPPPSPLQKRQKRPEALGWLLSPSPAWPLPTQGPLLCPMYPWPCSSWDDRGCPPCSQLSPHPTPFQLPMQRNSHPEINGGKHCFITLRTINFSTASSCFTPLISALLHHASHH